MIQWQKSKMSNLMNAGPIRSANFAPPIASRARTSIKLMAAGSSAPSRIGGRRLIPRDAAAELHAGARNDRAP